MHGSYRDGVDLRADKDLTHVTEWIPWGISPQGLGIFNRTGSGYEHRYEHTSAGTLAMGDDGRVYTSTGTIYTSELAAIGRVDGTCLIPGVGGSLVLGLTPDGKLTVYPAGKATPLGPCGTLPGLARRQNNGYVAPTLGDAADKRVKFLPARNKIVFIPTDDDRIVCREFDLKAKLDESGVDYLVVTSTPPGRAAPSSDWTYPVSVLSRAGEAKFSLDLAPEGMNVSSSGQITWKVPASFAKGEKVVLLVTDKSGEQTYHNFTIEPEAPAKADEAPK
jgi:hypothetical protein